MLQRGTREKTRFVDVFLAESPASRSRLGLIVPKYGHTIVERNRVKRRLREIGRRAVLPGLDMAGTHRDVLVRASRKAYDAAFDELESDVTRAVEALCSHGR